MVHPIIVYLDSQDFSRIAAPPAKKVAFYKELELQLSELIDSGTIEIRYSAIHISEIAHVNAGAAKFSGDRATILERLTSRRCMRLWYDVLDDEITNHFNKAHQIIATAENDLWIEAQTSEIKDFLESMRASIQEALQERGANRKARRAANKLDLVHLFTQTQQGKNALEKVAHDLQERFPTRETIDGKLLTDYVTGKIERKKFAEHLHKILVEPANLIQRLAPTLDPNFKLPAIVRDLSRTLVDMNPKIEKLAETLRNVPQSAAFDQIRRVAQEMPTTTMSKVRNNFVRGLIDKRPEGENISIDDAEIAEMKLPTIDTLFGMATKHLNDVVAAALSNKPHTKFNMSDGGDLSHAAYLPYVDVFRCDTSWTTALKPEGKKFQTTIVDRIENLIVAIKETHQKIR